MKHVAVTGNIGCGKSYVTNRLRELWEPSTMLVNMDHEGFRFVYGEGKRYLINNFLTTDKRMISSLVFGNPVLLGALNAHFLPDIKRIFLDFIEWPSPIIIEFPLLFECFSTPEERAFIRERCTIVTIFAEDDVRYQRAMGRDGKSLEQIREIDQTQLPQLEKCKLSDLVMVNDPAKVDTEQVIQALMDELNGQGCSDCTGILYPIRKDFDEISCD